MYLEIAFLPWKHHTTVNYILIGPKQKLAFVVLRKWCNVVDAMAVVSAKTARALKQKGPAPTVSQAKTTNVATDLA